MKIEGKKLNIAVIIRNFDENSGGAERYCVEVTRRLSDLHCVHVFSQNIKSKANNVTFHNIKRGIKKPRFLNRILFSYRTKRAISKSIKFDIIHAHDLVSHANVYTIHTPCFKEKTNNSSLIHKFLISPREATYLYYEKKVFSKKNQIISVSELLTQNIVKNYPDISTPTIAYPGININLKKFIDYSYLKQYHIPKNKFIVLFVGNGFIRKGLNFIVEALEILDDKDIFLFVAGDGNQKDIEFRKKTVKNNSIFLGKVENIEQIYLESNVLVHPSTGDTFGMVVLEAMSYSLPVIVTSKEFCGISETLRDDEALFLDNPTNSEKIANLLSRLKNNKKFSKQIENKAKDYAKKMSWELTTLSTLSAYEEYLTFKK